jgi:hypothetical protein
MMSVGRELPWRLRPSTWRVAWWATRSFLSARNQLRHGVAYPVIGPPPSTPRSAGIGMEAAMSRVRATCLEAAVVRQRWLAAHGDALDIIIGVSTSRLGDQPAHAWVDGTDPRAAASYVELHRFQSQAPCNPSSEFKKVAP